MGRCGRDAHHEGEPESAVRAADLIYGLNDKPPLRLSIFVALQHVLGSIRGDRHSTLDHFTCARAARRRWHYSGEYGAFGVRTGHDRANAAVGTRRLGAVEHSGHQLRVCRSVTAVGGSRRDSLGVVFGVCLATSLVPIAIGPFIRLAREIITPLVTGIVVTLIGLTLVAVGITSVGGGFEAKHDGTFGSAHNLEFALIVIALIVSLSNSRREWLRTISIVAGLFVGYAVAILAGKVPMTGLSGLPWFAVPAPFRYGLGFRITAMIPFAFLYLITAIESIGDITATSSLTGEPIAGSLYFRRLRGGVMADGVSSLLAAVFNSFPSTTFAQNNGVIQLTGIGSRYIGTIVGVAADRLGALSRGRRSRTGDARSGARRRHDHHVRNGCSCGGSGFCRGSPRIEERRSSRRYRSHWDWG